MLSWKCHINQVLSRLSLACYAIKVITPFMSGDTLKMIYYSYVHSILTYGIIFWDNSPYNTDIFKTQKWIIRIMTKSRSRDPCRWLFKQLEILPLQSILCITICGKKQLYTSNQDIHNINTRSNINLHSPVCNLIIFQKGVYFSGIKLFNHLPLKIKSLSNEIKLFKLVLKKFLILHSFHTVEEYFEYSYN
jgi:hypothetical protein